MVFWTSLPQNGNKATTIDGNDSYRTKNGFKELHIHNSPPRKNPDFKPMLYGDFIGMLNFKLSEPWAMMRHFPDLVNEQHQKPILWAKSTIKGAIAGFLYTIGMTFSRNEYLYVEKKLFLTHSQGPFTFSVLRRALKNFYMPMGYGAGLFLGYHLLYDFFTHHNEAEEIPDILTHAKIWAVMSPLLISYLWRPKHAITGSVLVLGLAFPLFYSIKEYVSGDFAQKDSYYFYQSGVTQAEKDKFEFQDRIEAIGYTRMHEGGYGDQRHTSSFLR